MVAFAVPDAVASVHPVVRIVVLDGRLGGSGRRGARDRRLIHPRPPQHADGPGHVQALATPGGGGRVGADRIVLPIEPLVRWRERYAGPGRCLWRRRERTAVRPDKPTSPLASSVTLNPSSCTDRWWRRHNSTRLSSAVAPPSAQC